MENKDKAGYHPTPNEIRAWLLGTIKHVQHIEYYLEQLQIGKEDPQRPHDIMGEGNKFEWEVIKGFAIQYRDRTQEFFNKHITPSLERHRCQHHHQKWNNPNQTASDEDMKVGAVDAICSLLEPDREYQGGKHSSEKIKEKIAKNPQHKQKWMESIHKEMQRIKKPTLEIITDLQTFPNLGLNKSTYETIKDRTIETLKMLREHGYSL